MKINPSRASTEREELGQRVVSAIVDENLTAPHTEKMLEWRCIRAGYYGGRKP